MNDDELTRLAVKLLEKEAEQFVRQRALAKAGPLKANKQFLSNTLKHNEISNRRINEKLEPKTYSQETNQFVPKPTIKKKSHAARPQKVSSVDTAPVKRHLFNSDLFKQKNRSPVATLTKDSKVSFKLLKKKKCLEESKQSEKDEETETEKVEIIDISDAESVISVSSAESPEVVRRHHKKSKIKKS